MLIEGPFESDYSLAIVNRQLALAMVRLGHPIQLHQRDNTTHYAPGVVFLAAWPELAPHFLPADANSPPLVHSRYIYPPYTDGMTGKVRAIHCYGWEESAFPRQYAASFNKDIDVITVMSGYVRDVLVQSGVTVPVAIAGLGADHILESPAEPIGCFDRDRFHFLHVSSCFPRKGVDVLMEAFCREFDRSQDVSLVIKTFPNPHNEIEKIVADAFARFPEHPPVKVIFDSYSPGQMRSLLAQANCLVAPSRGEGFGLPVAEAMLLGTPVIATIHGGHADLCSPEWCWPVDFRLEAARTHLTEGHSVWAEPDLASLRFRMRELYESRPDAVRMKTARAREHIETNFTWSQAARRHEEACNRALDAKLHTPPPVRSGPRPSIGFVSTWNARCGIAEYTRYLSSSLSSGYKHSVFANRIPDAVRPDEPNVVRCWTSSADELDVGEIDEVVRRICAAHCEVVSIQYNLGLMAPNTLGKLLRRFKGKRIPVLVTLHAATGDMHNTKNAWLRERYRQLIPVLKDAQAVIVHRTEDRERLRSAGLDNVSLQRHGIYAPKHLQRVTPAGADENVFTLACFGFFLPPKGIYELLQAFSAAAHVNPNLRLKLINSLYDIAESHAYAAECMRMLRARGLLNRVMVSTGFLDQDAILRELADSDLVVLPYTSSSEASSAAIRFPLASLTPVLCSDLPIFREFAEVVFRYPAQDTVALANWLLALSTDPGLLRKVEAGQRRCVEDLAWSNVARDFESIVDSSRTRLAALTA
jgi:glycosyltransferase involved in cell wall biosynthesis